ncbi:cation-translocating P-type ATPase family protein [Telmatocola sphagniphila]|uniref:P-type Zn(2+) transporter n=1 Tax=Telmatocola sphagniphila TaxID=1123043 RepID=A0A8E6B7J9_9BACT|nr:cation-translocating P-type ATPase family protein [Telmatocola sphagniphila]QVL33328.1 cation-translocating P-type ATPase family protein [Telmatocola sphagniphila]
MHREIEHAGEIFERPKTLGIYLFTSLLLLLLLADIWVPFSACLSATFGTSLPSWRSQEIYGFRLAQIAAILGGARVLFGSLEKLFAGKISADLATAIACIAAIAMNEPLIAAEVIVIGLVGECLEIWTFERARQGVQKLIEVFPLRCWKLVDGQEQRVFTSELAVGDTILVKPGGKIPVDGTILEGTSSIDLSALTGESLPVDKKAGDIVLAGSVNQFGALTIRADQVASATAVGHMILQTAQALKNKAQVERQVDRLATWFLPALLAVAFAVFALNVFVLTGPWKAIESRLNLAAAARQSLYPTLGVLVVACPCALLLATPAAVIAALGRLAGTGIVIKGGAVIEKLASIRALAFDKTGTLTQAKLKLRIIKPIGSVSESDILRLAGAIEKFSEHPIAACILEEVKSRNLDLPSATEFQAYPGAGASGLVDGQKVLIGNGRFLQSEGVPILDISEEWEKASEASATILYVAVDSRLIGILGVQDTIRLEAADVLAALRADGIDRFAILTGDRSNVAGEIGHALNISDVHGELFPQQKADWLKLHPDYAYIGDGINDALALATAPVGLAIRHPQSDSAAEAGDVILYGDPLGHLPLLMRLSRETVKVIRQNILVFAFLVNLIGVVLVGLLWPLIFGGGPVYEKSPLVGVIYHQFGSLAVLLNSLRLLFFERKSSALGFFKIKIALKSFDIWVDRYFNLDHLIHEITHHANKLTAGLAGLLLVLWALSGLVQVGPDEIGICKRFGHIEELLEPGLHLRYPFLVEETIKLKPNAVRNVELGFRVNLNSTGSRILAPKSEMALSWTNSHTEDLYRISDESLMLTGDGNLVDVLASVQYIVDDPAAYLTTCEDTERLVRLTFESLLRERLAGEAFLDLLTIRRNQLVTELLLALNERLQSIHPQKLGIELVGMTLPDLHPPTSVVPAYHDVARAIQGRDQQINQALAESIRKRSRAEEDAGYLTRIAEAAAAEKVRQAEGARDAFLAWVKFRSQITEDEERAIQTQIAEPQQREKARAELLTMKRQLTEFRLSLEAAVQFLKGRDKVLIDADKVPGKRSFFLLDPEVLKVIMPSDPKP